MKVTGLEREMVDRGNLTIESGIRLAALQPGGDPVRAFVDRVSGIGISEEGFACAQGRS
jgi:hypothetical protein